MGYLAFIGAQYPFLFFGFVMMLMSNFGQTFFIGLYSNDIRGGFGLSHAEFGGLYSAMTLLSALLLLYSGRFIDTLRLSRFTGMTLAGLALACLFMALAPDIAGLALALFALRHFGQGLGAHTGMTSMGRAYERNRGRAVAVAQLGYASGEAVFPVAILALVAWVGWQQSWLALAMVVFFAALPMQVFLTRFEPPRRAEAETADTSAAFGRMDVLRDPRFYLILPLYMASPFLLTGMFLTHAALADERGWPLTLIAAGFISYALSKIVLTLATGIWVDRFTALRVLPFGGLPLAAAFATLALPPDMLGTWAAHVYLAFSGVCIGMMGPVGGGLWAELYGVQRLGAIRSMTTPISIFATAAAPVAFGLMIDAGLSFDAVSGLAALYVLAAIALAFAARFPKLAAQ